MNKSATVVLSSLIAACATQSGAPAPAAGADLKRTTEGAVAASAPVGTSPIAAAPVAEVVDQRYVKRGYKTVHRNGQLLYCQSQMITGSLLQNTVCLSDAQMKAADQKTREMVDQINKMRDSGTCNGPKC